MFNYLDKAVNWELSSFNSKWPNIILDVLARGLEVEILASPMTKLSPRLGIELNYSYNYYFIVVEEGTSTQLIQCEYSLSWFWWQTDFLLLHCRGKIILHIYWITNGVTGFFFCWHSLVLCTYTFCARSYKMWCNAVSLVTLFYPMH